MIGWIFIGDAFYFLYALIFPRWHNARAQLWSFLACDVVLLPPLLEFTSSVRPERTISLTIYLAVLVYSAAVAVYYLLLNRDTRAHRPTLSSLSTILYPGLGRAASGGKPALVPNACCANSITGSVDISHSEGLFQSPDNVQLTGARRCLHASG